MWKYILHSNVPGKINLDIILLSCKVNEYIIDVLVKQKANLQFVIKEYVIVKHDVWM